MDFDSLSNLTISSVSAAFITDTSTRANRITNRENWCIMVKASGETRYTCAGRQYVCNPNHVIITPRGSSYEFRQLAEGRFAFLSFDALQSHDEIMQIPVKNCQPLLDIFRRIDHMILSNAPLHRISCITETYNVLLYLLKSTVPKYTPSANQKKIQPAMDYLIRNYTRPLTNDELASQTEYSTSHFRKLFFDVYGVSPLVYLQRLRISKAREMLTNSAGSVSEIASALGYSSVYDFSRVFKRETGISPSAFARNLR